MDGTCVVYWMQRAQRGVDNPALDAAVDVANALGKPVVVFFAPVPFYPNANLRHYQFLVEGIPDIAESLEKRNVGFVLRRYPDHKLLKFCEEVRPAIVIGDENPMREPEAWRNKVTKQLSVPFWTVDADVIVPRDCWKRNSTRRFMHGVGWRRSWIDSWSPLEIRKRKWDGRLRRVSSLCARILTSRPAGTWTGRSVA